MFRLLISSIFEGYQNGKSYQWRIAEGASYNLHKGRQAKDCFDGKLCKCYCYEFQKSVKGEGVTLGSIEETTSH